MIRSIRLTLTLWYLGILALILCLFSSVLYTNVATALARDIDDVLTSQSDGVAEALFSFWQAQWGLEYSRGAVADASAAAKLPTIQGAIEAGRFPELVTRWSSKTGELATVRPIRLIGRDGQVQIGRAHV